ncbi:hypothetical protein ACFX2B_041129 [Malus domestica]
MKMATRVHGSPPKSATRTPRFRLPGRKGRAFPSLQAHDGPLPPVRRRRRHRRRVGVGRRGWRRWVVVRRGGGGGIRGRRKSAGGGDASGGVAQGAADRLSAGRQLQRRVAAGAVYQQQHGGN